MNTHTYRVLKSGQIVSLKFSRTAFNNGNIQVRLLHNKLKAGTHSYGSAECAGNQKRLKKSNEAAG